MTYTPLESTTQISDVYATLNGVTTRTLFGRMDVAPSGSASLGSACGVQSMEFGLGERALLSFLIPERVDNAVAPTLRFWIAPCASESGKEVEFSYSFDVATASAEPVAGTLGTTIDGSDVAVSALLGTVQQVDIPLTTAVWGGATSGLILGELARTPITDGIELAADCAVIAASLVYTIER